MSNYLYLEGQPSIRLVTSYDS